MTNLGPLKFGCAEKRPAHVLHDILRGNERNVNLA